jgi:hypothetical protein
VAAAAAGGAVAAVTPAAASSKGCMRSWHTRGPVVGGTQPPCSSAEAGWDAMPWLFLWRPRLLAEEPCWYQGHEQQQVWAAPPMRLAKGHPSLQRFWDHQQLESLHVGCPPTTLPGACIQHPSPQQLQLGLGGGLLQWFLAALFISRISQRYQLSIGLARSLCDVPEACARALIAAGSAATLPSARAGSLPGSNTRFPVQQQDVGCSGLLPCGHQCGCEGAP